MNVAVINHSCSPNVEVQLTSPDGFLRVVAVKPIAEDEPLTLSYLPLPIPDDCWGGEGGNSGKQSYGIAGRHQDLKEAFFFDCDCGCE